jgi:hypothetical protein
MSTSRTRLASALAGALLLTGAAPTPMRADRTDDALRAYQAAFLDPQATDGVAEVGADHHHAHHQHVTSAVRVSGVAGAQHAVAAALPPGTGGRWSFLTPFPSTFTAIHAIVGPSGKVLLVAGSGYNRSNFDAGTFRTYVWMPASGQRREVPTPEDLFCSGHALLPDGRALVGGGTTAYAPYKGSTALCAFTTERYERLTPLEIARWYPSIVNGADGRSLIISGLDGNGLITSEHEVFDYRTNTHTPVPGARQFPLYPHIFRPQTVPSSTPVRPSPPARCRRASGDPSPATRTNPVPGLALPGQRAGATSCFVGDIRNQHLMVLGAAGRRRTRPATSS